MALTEKVPVKASSLVELMVNAAVYLMVQPLSHSAKTLAVRTGTHGAVVVGDPGSHVEVVDLLS
jgi:hypothetical protein